MAHRDPSSSVTPPNNRQTTHVIVDVAGHVFIISSLSSRSDVLVCAIDAVSGSLTHDGHDGIDVFKSEAEALSRVDPRSTGTRKRVPALLGYTVHGAQGHLLVATKLRRLQAHGSHVVSCVDASAWIRCPLLCRDSGGRREGLLIASLRSYPMDGCHYFSETIDLTRPHIPCGESFPSHGRESAPEFVWNAHLASPFVAIGLADCCRPLLHGVVHAGSVKGEGDVFVRYLFLTRRSSRSPYPSAVARGMSKDGGVANESECELCFWTSEEYASETKVGDVPQGRPSTWVDFRSVVFRKGTAPVVYADPSSQQYTTSAPGDSPANAPLNGGEADGGSGLGDHVRGVLRRFAMQRMAFVSLLRGGGVTSVTLERAVAKLRRELRAELALVRYDWELTCSLLGGMAGAMEGLWEIARGVCRDMGMFGARMEMGPVDERQDASPACVSARTEQQWTVSILCENGINATSLAGLALACNSAASAVASLGFVPARETPSASPSTRRSNAQHAPVPIAVRAPEGIPIVLANTLGHGFLYAIAQFLAADADQSSRAYELHGNPALADSLKRMAAGVPQDQQSIPHALSVSSPQRDSVHHGQQHSSGDTHSHTHSHAGANTHDHDASANRIEAISRCEQIDVILGRRLVELLPSYAHPQAQPPHLISMLPGAFCIDLEPIPLTTSEGATIPADAMLLPPGWGSTTVGTSGSQSSLSPWTFYMAPPGCDRVAVTVSLSTAAHVTALALWIRHGECDVTSPQTMDFYVGTHADTLEPVLQDIQLPYCRDGTRICYSIPSPASVRVVDPPVLFRFGADHTRRPPSRFARVILRGGPVQAQLTLGAVEVYGVRAPSPLDPMDASSSGHLVATPRTVDVSTSLDVLLARSDATNIGIPPAIRSKSFDYRTIGQGPPSVGGTAAGRASAHDAAPRSVTFGDLSPMVMRRVPLLDLEGPSGVTDRRLFARLPSLEGHLDEDAAAHIDQYARHVSNRVSEVSTLTFYDTLILEKERLRLGVTPAQRASVLSQLGIRESLLDPNRFVYRKDDGGKAISAGAQQHGTAATGSSVLSGPFSSFLSPSSTPSSPSGGPSAFQVASALSPSSLLARGRVPTCHGCKSALPNGTPMTCRYCSRNFCDRCMHPDACTIIEHCADRQTVCVSCRALVDKQQECLDEIARLIVTAEARERRSVIACALPYATADDADDADDALALGSAYTDSCGKAGRPRRMDAADEWSLAEHPRASLVYAVPSDMRSPPPECVLLPPDGPSPSGLSWIGPVGSHRAEFVVALSAKSLVRRVDIIAGAHGFRSGAVPAINVRTGSLAADIASSSVCRKVPSPSEQLAGVGPYGLVSIIFPSPVICRVVSICIEVPTVQDGGATLASGTAVSTAAASSGGGTFASRLSVGRIRVIGEPTAHSHRTTSLSVVDSAREDAKAVTRNHVKPLQTAYRQGGRLCDLTIDPMFLVGFSVIARHSQGSPLSQVRLVRVTVVGRVGPKAELSERTVGVFVVPLTSQGTHLFFDVEDMGTGSLVTFEALASHGASTMCVPLKVAVYTG